MSNAVAKVVFLQGQAWAKAPDGTMRALTVGSTLNDDEILMTGVGSKVELDSGNGEPLVINGGLSVGMSRDLFAATATEPDEALLSDASVQEALTVLEQGGDLLDELEETAAGNSGGGSGSDGGSSFVRLTRLMESTDAQSFEYDRAAAITRDVGLNDGEFVNRAPVVTDQTLTTNEDESFSGQIIAQDIEGDALTFTLSTAPTNGVVVLDPVTGQFTFTPNANYNGPESFVVTVTDSRGNATDTRITFNVTPVNDAPTANDVALTTDEDVAVSGQVVAQDVEGDVLTYTITGNPANGTVVLNAATGAFVYTPNSNYNGNDSFTVTISDGNGGTTTSTVTVGVAAVNDLPVAQDLSLTTDEDVAVNGQIIATDVDGDTLGYAVTTGPTNGSVVLNAATGAFVYTPNTNYNGNDSFTVTISDGNGGTTTSTVTVGVNPLNDAPVAADLSLTTDEEVAVNGQISASDIDGDTLAYAITGNPTNGTVTLNVSTGAFVYTPNTNFNGNDSFEVTISDGKGGTTTSTVTVGVNPVNDAPVALDDTATTDENTAVTIVVRANDTDIDGDSLTVTGVTQGANGSVVIDTITKNPIYTPNSGFSGTDTFTYTVEDGQGGSATATVTVTVNPVNDVPVLTITQVNNFVEDAGAAVGDVVATFTTSDADNDTVTVTLSDTVNYALSGNTVVLTAAGLALVNSGA
ncbi:MAG TPA: retention module-containing protein, partial [Cellvibrio sp.]|nr:retention module-containing protein [Cellvibrio sp.]